jgi:hypothetical protein
VKKEEHKQIENELHLKEEITYIEHYESYKSFCEEKGKPCILAFLDGRKNNNSLIEFGKSLRIIDKIRSNPKHYIYSVSWINATCQTNLTRKFSIDLFPNIVLYLPIKNLSSILIGSFDEKKIMKFISKFANGSAHYNHNMTVLAEDFNQVKCENLQESIDNKGIDFNNYRGKRYNYSGSC